MLRVNFKRHFRSLQVKMYLLICYITQSELKMTFDNISLVWLADKYVQVYFKICLYVCLDTLNLYVCV